MKRIFRSCAFLLGVWICCLSADAQLVVDSLGRIGMGTDTPTYPFDIKGPGTGATVAGLWHGGEMYGFRVNSTTVRNQHFSPVGVYVQGTALQGSSQIGMRSYMRSVSSRSAAETSVGIIGDAFLSKCNVGVMGRVLADDSASLCIGVYGAVTKGFGSLPALDGNPAKYAGLFVGPVRVNGKIYGTLYTPTSTSSFSNVNASRPVALSTEDEESISDRLLSVQTLQFVREKEDVNNLVSHPTRNVIVNDAADLQELSERGSNKEVENVYGENQAKMVKHYGVDAEQLKMVFPELVSEDQQGEYHVNYSEMVPLLLQSIRELSLRLEKLEGRKNVDMVSAKVKTTSTKEKEIEGTREWTDVVYMSQNSPNPFNENSQIKLNIPRDAKNATIYIYDLAGKMVKSIVVDGRGKTDVVIHASALSEGMFVYSLVVDGSVFVTRRLLVAGK